MSKSRLAFLGIIFLIIASCAKNETATTDTAASGAATTSAAVSTAAVPTTTIPPPPPRPDHYKFWKVEPVAFAAPVSLRGQFDKEAWWDARVRAAEYLGNPVDKNKEGIRNERLHYVAYAIAAKQQPPRTVQFTNQFTREDPKGIATWRITQPTLLLVPADKRLDGQPEKPLPANHYACYQILDPKPMQRPVTLVDQFDRRQQKIEEIRELVPAYFCVPVEKKYKDRSEPILDPVNHLVIYRIVPQEKFSITAMTLDQFGPRKLQVLYSELLAVPSVKRSWEPK